MKEISEVIYVHNASSKQTEEESLESDLLDEGNPDTDIPDIDPMLISDDFLGDIGDNGGYQI